MSLLTRLSAYLLLPLLLAVGSFLAMRALGGDFTDSLSVTVVILGISILFGLLPILLYRYFVHSQLHQGFALMTDGSVRLPRELGIADVLGERIAYWRTFEQPLATEVRLHGRRADLQASIRVNLSLWPDKHGKKLARHFDKALPLLERAIQQCLYNASLTDDGFALALDGSTLLNEDDERVLKSKFLSALETLALQGVFFPHEAAGIYIDRNVKKIPRTGPEIDTDQVDDAELNLDNRLLKSAGVI